MNFDWLPLLLASLSLLGGVFAYWNQKRIDRQDALIGKRQDVYRRFLEALFDHVEQRSQVTRVLYDRMKCELVLVASDEVLEALVSVQEAATMDMVALGPEDVNQRASELVKLMRSDCFETSKLDEDVFGYILAIGRATPVNKSDMD